jgi:restriction system protein
LLGLCRGKEQGKTCSLPRRTHFSKDAEEYAASIDSRIVLITGRRLAGLLIDHGVGITQAGSYDIRRIDSDYFEES